MNFEIKNITKDKVISIFKNYCVLLFSIIVAISSYFISKYPPLLNYKLFNENISLSSLIICILICISAILPLIIFKCVYKYKFIPRHIQFIWLFATPLICFFITEVIANIDVSSLTTPAIILNYLSYSVITFLIFALSGSVRFSIIISLVISYIFSLTDTYVLKFRGTPFSVPDILAYKTAANVASEYSFYVSPAMILTFVTIICISVLAGFMSKKNQEYKLGLVYKIIFRVVSLSLCTLYILICSTTYVLDNYNISLDIWNPNSSRVSNGVFLNFSLTTKYVLIDKPDDYSPEKAQQVVSNDNIDKLSTLGNLDNPLKKQVVVNNGEVPTNIIVIMNESLSDLSVLGDLQTNEDYMPFIHSLTENTIKGNVYLSQFGARTANSEYEFLSGNNMAFTPTDTIIYQRFLRDDMSSLANILKTQNDYYTFASHSFFKSSWNRENAYNSLKFDETRFIEEWPTEIRLLREYPSDETNYEGVINLLSNNNSKNKFMMNVTMQNHGGYDTNKIPIDIKPTNLSKEYPLANEYLNCIKQSDNAFKGLVEYYQNSPEPTIILMFGDHQPNIEPEFFEELLGKSQNELTLEELQKKYITPFVMWANYDIPEMEIEQISLNYLSTLLMEYSNIELPPYNQFLQNLYQSIPVINSNGYIDYNGVHHNLNEKNEFSDLINSYHIVQYNDLFDKKK